MKPVPELSVLIISYNTREMTLGCLRSIYKETQSTSFEVIVLDNASGDGSAEAIASQFPDVRLLAETQNFGFAKGNNIASKFAEGEYILLLNPDTVVLDGAIEKLLSFSKRYPQAGIWGGRTLFGDLKLNPTSCWRRMSLWSIACRSFGLANLFPSSEWLNSEGYGGWLRDTEREVDIVTGCLLLIRKKDWDELGGFDETFFMYGEEADLCIRARALGASPMITPSATIIHFDGASEKNRADRMVRLLSARVSLANRYFSRWKRIFAYALFATSPLVRIVVYGVRSIGSSRRHANDLQLWLKVWQERRIWLRGYS